MLRKNIRKDDPNSGYCAIPGGKLDDNEKGLKHPQGRLESAIRETKGETGIIPINPILRGAVLFDNKDRTFDNWPNPDNFYVYLYSATEYSGELKESDEGIPFWASKKEIPSLPKNPGDKLLYKWLMSRNFRNGMNLLGVIKHKYKRIDRKNSWVNWC